MKVLKLYHLIPFFIFWFMIEKQFKTEISLPDLLHLKVFYMSISIISLLIFLKINKIPKSFEIILIIMSFVLWTKIAMKFMNELIYPDVFHALFITLYLMSLRNDIINAKYIKRGYFIVIMYTCFANLTKQQNITSSLLDFFTVHFLFYLLK
tara:strand:+ start:63 stop:518 length:456 start_codon:yes stop_codon:yes gene_type:complete